MRIDDEVKVYCTDFEKYSTGHIISIGKDSLRVAMPGGVALNFKQLKPKVYVATQGGMEFVIKT